VRVRFGQAPVGLEDLATGQPVAAGDQWHVELGPYQLRALALAPDVDVREATAYPPAAVAEELAGRVARARCELAELAARGLALPGAEQLQRELPAALAAGRLAWVRRALDSYVVRKARQLLGDSG
jgi:hypothetical protein